MKTILTFIFLLMTSYHTYGQISNDTVQTSIDKKIIETAPEPKGGMTGFFKYLSSKLDYPKDARKQKIEGEVLVEFVVSSNGMIRPESVRIVQGVFESLDNEAMRVIKLSPKWTPGTQNGQPIDMRMVMPIIFRLQK